MHDETLERRLTSALRDEADRQPFTITAAELERRDALRSRGAGNRRLTLLLAAAVAIGALGVGAAVGGLSDNLVADQSPVPSAEATPRASEPVVATLPDLDALIAENLSGEVVFAQSHGEAEGPEPIPGVVSWAFPPPFVRFDPFGPGGSYAIALACRVGSASGGSAEVALVPRAAAVIPCDGRTHNETIDVDAAGPLELSFSEPAHWRVVVRRALSTSPTPPADPAELQVPAGHEALVSVFNETNMFGTINPIVPGMPGMTQEYGVAGARLSYVAQASCVGGSAIRFAFGDNESSGISLSTLTQVPCDGLAHAVRLGIPEPNGRQVFVGAEPTVHWSLLITSTAPPVSLAENRAGWEMQVGFGPHLSFDGTEHAFSAPGVDGGGSVLLVIACAGPNPIEFTVDVGRQVGEREETLVAECTPEGAETEQSFEFETSQVSMTFGAPVGTWTAISILVPPSPDD